MWIQLMNHHANNRAHPGPTSSCPVFSHSPLCDPGKLGS